MKEGSLIVLKYLPGAAVVVFKLVYLDPGLIVQRVMTKLRCKNNLAAWPGNLTVHDPGFMIVPEDIDTINPGDRMKEQVLDTDFGFAAKPVY